MGKVHNVRRPSTKQLQDWLYDAEFDWDTAEHEAKPPSDSFPRYYSEVYEATLAELIREILEHRS